MGGDLLGDAGTRVRDAQQDVPVLPRGADPDGPGPSGGVLAHGLHRVGQQVQHGLLDLVSVAVDPREVGSERQVEVDLAEPQLVADEGSGALRDVVEIHVAHVGRALASEREQIPHDARRALGLFVNHAQVIAVPRRRAGLLHEELGKTRDGGQGVVQLVGHAGDELPDGRELLRLEQLRFQRFLFGDVLDEDDHPALLHAPEPRRADAQHAVQGAGPLRERRPRLAGARAVQQLSQLERAAPEGGGQLRADHVGERLSQERGQGPIRPADAARFVQHRDPVGECVERGFPLLLTGQDQIEEPGVGESQRGMGGDGRDETEVAVVERPG